MISIMLTILKIIGMILLCIIGILILLILTVLFVPVRYQVAASRKSEEEELLKLRVKVTWLFHILNARFIYPEAAYLRIRIFCITVFDSRKQSKDEDQSEEKPVKEKKVKEEAVQAETVREDIIKEKTDSITESSAVKGEDSYLETKQSQTNQGTPKKKLPGFLRILKKIWHALINIKYTIKQICDKIKNIVNNVNYYMEIIKSDTFKEAWKKCSKEAMILIKSIRPRRVKGQFIIGTGDPASTAQVFGIYGLLYPLIGNRITVIPDMENPVLEGDFYMKGRITILNLVKAGITIYFNKNLRKVINMFKREAA